MSKISKLIYTPFLILLLALLVACGTTEEAPPAQQEEAAPVEEEAEQLPSANPTEEGVVGSGIGEDAAIGEEADPLPTPNDTPPEEGPPPAGPTEEAAADEHAEEDVAPTAEPEGAAEEEAAEAVTQTYSIVPAESQASYAVEEEFFNREIDFFTAVGVTQDINGQMEVTINPDNTIALGPNQFTVDLTTLETDSPRRDEAIRENWLESNTYPLAQFTATGVENFSPDSIRGEDINFTLLGDMTIREITNPMAFDVTARLEDETLTGTAVGNLMMVDYGFEPPNILDVLTVTDGVTVTVEFTATP